MDAHNRLNHISYPSPQRESCAGEECIKTSRPPSASQRTVGATESQRRRSGMRFVARHPGLQASGVILATALCLAVLPQLVAPGYVVPRSQNFEDGSFHWAVPVRREHRSTLTGQPAVVPAKTPSTVLPATTPTSIPQLVFQPRTVPVVSAIPPLLHNRIFRQDLIRLQSPEKDWRRKSIVSPQERLGTQALSREPSTRPSWISSPHFPEAQRGSEPASF